MRTHFNYVAYFPATSRIKIGITSNPERRAREYGQEAFRHGLGNISFCRGSSQFKGVARMVEQSIRDNLKNAALAPHHEWFQGDPEAFCAFIDMTTRLQRQTRNLLGVEAVNA